LKKNYEKKPKNVLWNVSCFEQLRYHRGNGKERNGGKNKEKKLNGFGIGCIFCNC
jgi:hypothetical protein